ncbi:VanZ family protein [Zhongshania sp.]|uniref:VanZ family protein n=1 Tax=Zhongshania sp. TaxID=1971902 RepID=UPI0039E6E6C7
MRPPFRSLHGILTGLYIFCIATLSLLPAEQAVELNVWDKAQHYAAYALFMLLVFPAAKTHTARLKLAVGVIAFSVLIELAQHFSPGRDASAEDAIANSLGVVSGYLFGWLLLTLYRLGHNRAKP